jgi:CRISPR-associated endonuclease/helicase Cas3
MRALGATFGGNFKAFFKQATRKPPHPYEIRLATAKHFQELLDIPTGLGKTAAVIFAWLYRRRFADEKTRQSTPRRLVYCLPMRVLVENRFVVKTFTNQ